MVDNAHVRAFYPQGDACVAPYNISPYIVPVDVSLRPVHRLQAVIDADLRKSAPSVRIRGQPSRSMVVHLEVFTTWARRASPLPRHAPDKTGTACRWRSMGIVSFVWGTISAIGGKSASSVVRHSPRAQDLRSTIGVDARSPGDLYNLGEACLAPTQIGPLLDRYGMRGRFRAPFPFAPVHSRRKSAKSGVRCSLALGRSRSTIGVDGRLPGGLYILGYTDMPRTRPVRRTMGAVAFASVTMIGDRR